MLVCGNYKARMLNYKGCINLGRPIKVTPSLTWVCDNFLNNFGKDRNMHGYNCIFVKLGFFSHKADQNHQKHDTRCQDLSRISPRQRRAGNLRNYLLYPVHNQWCAVLSEYIQRYFHNSPAFSLPFVNWKSHTLQNFWEFRQEL